MKSFTNKQLRKRRVRAKISGTAAVPRLAVSRGSASTVVQLFDDERGVVIAAVYERELSPDEKKKTKTERAHRLGSFIAKKGTEAGVKTVVFDRGGNAYHGRVRAVAEGAREGGLIF